MAYIRTRPQLLLAKIESVEGQDAGPDAATNSIMIENVQWNEAPNVIQTNEHAAALDVSAPIAGGVRTTVTFDTWVKSRAAGDTPPEFGVLLKGCGLSETVTAAAVPAAAEAMGSGSSMTQGTLGSSATGTGGLYTGMPIFITETGAMDSFIAAYTAAKLATFTDTAPANLTTTAKYQIPKNVVYRPASASLASLTIWLYRDGKLYKGVGARGTFTVNMETGGGIRFSFTFAAVWQQVTDSALVPGTFADGPKLVWRGLAGGHARARWNRILCQVRSLSFDIGNSTPYPDNPEGIEGYDPAQITLRNASFSMDPLETLLATRDIKADMRANQPRILHARAYNGAAGGGFAVTAPAAQATAQGDGDRDGFAIEQIQGRCTGANDSLHLCFY